MHGLTEILLKAGAGVQEGEGQAGRFWFGSGRELTKQRRVGVVELVME